MIELKIDTDEKTQVSLQQPFGISELQSLETKDRFLASATNTPQFTSHTH